MSVAVRDELRALVEALPEQELEPARKALRELIERASEVGSEDVEAQVDRQMLEEGLLETIPRQEDILRRPKTPRPRMPGKPVSETLIEDRR